jgi:hypothetical protein
MVLQRRAAGEPPSSKGRFMSSKPLVRGLPFLVTLLGGALIAGGLFPPLRASAQVPAKLRSPKVVRGFYRQAVNPVRASNQTGTFVFLFWNGPSAETDTICFNVYTQHCDTLGCHFDTTFTCDEAWQGYRVRRTIEGITPNRLSMIGQWRARDSVVPLCVAQQDPCDLQNFTFTGTGIFFKGFRNNKLANGSYIFDYPPGSPADADSTARIFVDLAPLVGFRHEYAVTSIDTLIMVNADFAESPVDSSELVYLTPATPPTSNMEFVGVVPNPYKEFAEWEPGPGQRQIHFINLPAGSTVRIFTAAGELLRTLKQDPSSSPGGTTGELIWDLKNEQGRTVVSGIYLYTVHPPDGRTPRKGHFVIIK